VNTSCATCVEIDHEYARHDGKTESVFQKSFLGSTGDPPVLSGDSPDGMGTPVRVNEDNLFPA
jgi:hypothetical protein